jgi:hypothetical protein
MNQPIKESSVKTLLLTQKKVTSTQMDLIESSLSNTALFSREAGAVIDLIEAKEQVEKLDSILPSGITMQGLDEENIQYLEIYL